MNVTDNRGAGDLNAALADLTGKGYSVTFEAAPVGACYALLVSPAGLLANTGLGADPAAALAAVWPLDDDGTDDDPDPRCATCGELVGQFGAGKWQHWHVIARVVETYDAGHDALPSENPVAGSACATPDCGHAQDSHWEHAEPDGPRVGCAVLGCACATYRAPLPAAGQ
jgi:hypothetical protein